MNDHLWNLYMKVVHGAGMGDIRSWAELDLTMPQMKILMILNTLGEATVGSLAEILNTSLSNMTGILDRLEGQGLIERSPSLTDRRSVVIQLTENAMVIFQNLNKSVRENLTRVINAMSEEERKTVENGLQTLAEALDKDKLR